MNWIKRQSQYEKTHRNERMLRIEDIIYLGTLILLTAFVGGAQTEAPDEDDGMRRAKGEEILRHMNLKINPCEDFYEYACGNWVAGDETEVITATSVVNAKIDEDLQQLLEEQVTVDDEQNGRKVKEFYKSCINTGHYDDAQQTFFSKFIEANGGFPAVPGSTWKVQNPEYNWQKIVAQLRYQYNMEILIGITVDVNYQNTIQNSIYLGEPSTLLPLELCRKISTKRTDIQNEEYAKVEKEVAERLMRWLSLNSNLAKNLATKLVDFEKELCTGMESKLEGNRLGTDSGLNLNYTRKTLFEWSHQINDTINLNQLILDCFNHPYNKPVFVRSESYYSHLPKVISNHNVETVANYIMYRALSYLDFPLNDSSKERTTRYCIDQVMKYFAELLGEMYYRKYGSQNAKTDVEAIYADIKNQIERGLYSEWIEFSSRGVGTQKLKDIRIKFPSYENTEVSSVKITPSDYWGNLQQLMAMMRKREFQRLLEIGDQSPPKPRDPIESYHGYLKYRPIYKRLDIAWGILHAPIYEHSYATSLRYSTIGAKLARELSFAFEINNWGLSPSDYSTAHEYLNRVRCFHQQLSNYLYNNPDQFQNNTELYELIATSNGLHIAFKAYLRWLSFMKPLEDYSVLIKETLPGLNLSNTQLFFVSFAQMSCRAKWKNYVAPPNFLPLQRHTLERYAINGPLRNSIEFAREFSCPPGSEMNPMDKCVIF